MSNFWGAVHRHAQRHRRPPQQREDITGGARAAVSFQRGQGHPLPDQRDRRHRHDAEKRTAPANDGAKQAAKRRGQHRCESVTTVDDRQSVRHVMMRHEPHGRSCRHRPETANGHTDQCPTDDECPVVGRQRDHYAGDDRQQRQQQKEHFAIEPGRHRRDEQAGQQGKRPGNGDSLPRLTFSEMKAPRDGCQQTHRHEFRCNQYECGERQREHRAPCWSPAGDLRVMRISVRVSFHFLDRPL